MAERGEQISLRDIEDATGISRKALTEISKGRVRRIIPEYVDALCAYFGVGAGDLVEVEPVTLPLKLNIRPDRHGAIVGQRTKTPPPPATTPTADRLREERKAMLLEQARARGAQ